MTSTWFMDGARSLFSVIDSVVYGLISTSYDILMQLANIQIFSNSDFNAIATRVYTLLGIFMLFRVTFSFINYLVKPEDFTDKTKGVKNVIIHILVALMMIVIAPTAFDKMADLQHALLADQTLLKLVFGNEGMGSSSHSYYMADLGDAGNVDSNLATICATPALAKTEGEYLSIILFRPFYQINKDLVILDDEGLQAYCSIGTEAYSGQYATVDDYLSVLSTYKINLEGIAMKDVIIKTLFGKVGDLIIGDLGIYAINYKFFISTIVGIIVLLVIIGFCMDIGVRSVKLGFLQLIAPVPIISYVAPDSSKGNLFKKWIKEIGKTWADLFLRLFILYFAMYMIELFVSKDLKDIFGNEIEYKFWVDLFIIVGILIFAKQLPKLIEELTGLKLSSTFNLNPLKKFEDNALGGKSITKGAKKIVGGVAGAAAVGLAAGGANMIKGKGLKESILSGAGGFAGGAFRGFKGGMSNEKFGKNFSDSYKKTVGRREERASWNQAGSTLSDRISDRFNAAVGGKTKAELQDAEAKVYSDFIAHQDAIDKISEKEVMKVASTTTVTTKNGTVTTLGALEARAEQLKNDTNATPQQIADALSDFKLAQKEAKLEYQEHGGNAQIEAYINQMRNMQSQYKNDFEIFNKVSLASAKDIGDAKKAIETEKIELETSKSWTAAHSTQKSK